MIHNGGLVLVGEEPGREFSFKLVLFTVAHNRHLNMIALEAEYINVLSLFAGGMMKLNSIINSPGHPKRRRLFFAGWKRVCPFRATIT